MATPLSTTKLLAALKAEGITIQEYKSWKTNNRNSKGASGPRYGVVIHHTVSSADDASVDLCYRGHSTLPGPLCHAVGRNDGKIALVGHGRANHAGLGDDDVLAAVKAEAALPAPNEANTDGNAPFYGLEIVNLGNGTDTYPWVQYVAAVKWATAHCRAHVWTEKSVIGHKEWQPGKIDPKGPVISSTGGRFEFTMSRFRADVKAALALPAGKWTGASPVTPPVVVKPPVVVTPKPEEPSVGAPKDVTESYAGHQVLNNDFTVLTLGVDQSAFSGPCTYQATAYATVVGVPGTRVKARFEDYAVAAKRSSLDLEIEAGTIGSDGTLAVQVGRPGRLDAGEELRLALRAPGATVTRTILRGLRWGN